MPMGMKTTHVDFVQSDGDVNGNEDTLSSYRAMSVGMKTTHIDFVQDDVSRKEDYSR